MPSRRTALPVEVWLWEPSQERAPFDYESRPIEYLPVDAPLPRVGDLLCLPRNVTGDSKKQAFTYGGTRTPFRVMECEHVYFRQKGEKLKATDPQPARHVKTIVSVARMTEKEFFNDRGWGRESAG